MRRKNPVFVKNFRYLLERHGLKYIQAGELLGVSASVVGEWARGSGIPNSPNIEKICKLFEISAHDLMMTDLAGLDEELISVAEMSDVQDEAPPMLVITPKPVAKELPYDEAHPVQYAVQLMQNEIISLREQHERKLDEAQAIERQVQALEDAIDRIKSA